MREYIRLDRREIADRNALYLVIEIFWSGVINAAATFNAAYALRLEASNFGIGLLSSLPALIAVIVSIPAGQFLQTRTRRRPWIFGALALFRASYLLIALIPWLPVSLGTKGVLVLAILVGMNFPLHFFNVGWIPFLSDAVPENRRAAVFSTRNILFYVAMSACTFLFGRWLSQAAFPINYQLMYVLGFAASIVSTLLVLKVRVPEPEEVEVERKPRLPIRASLNNLKEEMAKHAGFQRIVANTFLHGLGLWTAGPLYILYFVRILDASEEWLGLQSTIASIGTIIGFASWRWILARWGDEKTLKRTIVLLGLYPLLVGLIPSLSVILLLVALNGLVVPAVNLSHLNTFIKVIPESNRPGYTGMYYSLVNLGAFVCPIISVILADRFGVAPVLVASGLLSIIGSTSFWWWPVHDKLPAATNSDAVAEGTRS
jgi:MFS family permease